MNSIELRENGTQLLFVNWTFTGITVLQPYCVESICSGDGGDQMGCTDCPCMNNAPAGTTGGCLNSAGTSAQLSGSGLPSIAEDSLRMTVGGATPNSFGVLTSGAALAPANMQNPCFGLDSGITAFSLDGLRCAVQSVQRHGSRAIDAKGEVGETTPGWGGMNGPPEGLAAQGGFGPGQTRHYQVIYRELPDQSCMTGQNTTQAISVTFLP